MSELRRAVELTGRNGRILGSESYFKELNKKYVVGFIKYGGKTFYYDEIIKTANTWLSYRSKEILDDLRKYAAYISYVDESKRKNLLNFIQGLIKFSQFAGNKSNYCNECISYL